MNTIYVFLKGDPTTVEQSTVTQLRQPNNKKFTIRVHVHATKLLRARQTLDRLQSYI